MNSNNGVRGGKGIEISSGSISIGNENGEGDVIVFNRVVAIIIVAITRLKILIL